MPPAWWTVMSRQPRFFARTMMATVLPREPSLFTPKLVIALARARRFAERHHLFVAALVTGGLDHVPNGDCRCNRCPGCTDVFRGGGGDLLRCERSLRRQ